MIILICNAGSTSLKFKIYEFPQEKTLIKGKIERIGDSASIFSWKNCLNKNSFFDDKRPIKNYVEGIKLFLDVVLKENIVNSYEEIDTVGFKTVLSRGYNGVHVIDEQVKAGMREYLDIAQVHNTAYLQAIESMEMILPHAKMVGVFETAFHQTITKEKYIYTIPYEWSEKYGIRKFGYHGSSHTYSATTIKKIYGDNLAHVSLHLGGSSSACAIYDGKSVDSSFQMSLQTGLPHANRAGDIDSFVFPLLMNRGLTMDEISTGLAKNGGLKGIFGPSGDLRDIEAAIKNNDERAKLAFDVFIYQICKYVGGFFVELGGLDVLTFSGGIGEKSVSVRKAVCQKLSCLGVELDENKNMNPDAYDGVISKDNSKVIVRVVTTDEEIIVARKSFELLHGN